MKSGAVCLLPALAIVAVLSLLPFAGTSTEPEPVQGAYDGIPEIRVQASMRDVADETANEGEPEAEEAEAENEEAGDSDGGGMLGALWLLICLVIALKLSGAWKSPNKRIMSPEEFDVYQQNLAMEGAALAMAHRKRIYKSFGSMLRSVGYGKGVETAENAMEKGGE